MQKRQLKKLLNKYRRGIYSEADRTELENWYLYHARNQQGPLPDEQTIEEDLDEVWQRLPVHGRRAVVRGWTTIRRMAAAAVVVLAASISLLVLWMVVRSPQGNDAVSRYTAAAHEAYILLDDSIKVNLDSVNVGESVEYGAVRIRKTTDQTLIYEVVPPPAEAAAATPAVMNVVNVPKAKQYDVLLPDGSKVKLNSFSTIRFPSVFGVDKREVVLKGEAYFEVVRDAAKPFHVSAGDVDIKVLGTRFNVSAYDDEHHIKTTLLSGSVQVTAPQHTAGASASVSKILKPGQQATVSRQPGTFDVSPVNADEAIAWVDGFISFNNTDLEAIMRKVARWYDIEVVYDGSIPKRRFTGGISKKAPLNELLQVLGIYNIDYDMLGDKLIIKQD